MKTAFACWEERIAPVFDTVPELCLVRIESGRIDAMSRKTMPDEAPHHRAARLIRLGVHTLVCGAISRPLHLVVKGHGIRVVPFIAGNLSEVIQAWLEGNLDSGRFSMPGCCTGGPDGCCRDGIERKRIRQNRTPRT